VAAALSQRLAAALLNPKTQPAYALARTAIPIKAARPAIGYPGKPFPIRGLDELRRPYLGRKGDDLAAGAVSRPGLGQAAPLGDHIAAPIGPLRPFGDFVGQRHLDDRLGKSHLGSPIGEGRADPVPSRAIVRYGGAICLIG